MKNNKLNDKALNKLILLKLRNKCDTIAKNRDELRIILEDYGEILESSDRGLEALEESIQTFSEYL